MRQSLLNSLQIVVSCIYLHKAVGKVSSLDDTCEMIMNSHRHSNHRKKVLISKRLLCQKNFPELHGYIRQESSILSSVSTRKRGFAMYLANFPCRDRVCVRRVIRQMSSASAQQSKGLLRERSTVPHVRGAPQWPRKTSTRRLEITAVGTTALAIIAVKL